ncbi:esterase family protein [Escherichia coli]|nr:esterase family protein [Escherichia coli]
MDIAYTKGWSEQLGRDMEFKRYGFAGRPFVVFPTSQGRFYQFEDSGGVSSLAEFIDTGRIQVFALDGIDSESFFNKGVDHAARIARHEAYFRYVREEALPVFNRLAQESNGGRKMKPIFGGCSMGGFHSSNFVFRNPELASGLIALSGVYSTKDFFGGDLSGQIYYNSLLNYLPGLEARSVLDRIRALRLIFCCGQGDWEERMLEDTRELEVILAQKKIPAWIDYWGGDVAHDWPWWHKQFPYFMSRWLDEDLKHRLD